MTISLEALPGIDCEKPVQVYRNLNKPGCKFSVRQGGRVRCYVDSIVLANARFKHASQKQLDAVRTGPRQVCQWISGIVSMVGPVGDTPPQMLQVACDPKKSDGFTVDGKRIDSAGFVSVSKNGCFAAR